MLTRRNFQLALSSVWLAVPSTVARSQDDETVTVRIRVDETVSGLLQPIELKSLSVEPDHSEDANKLANQLPLDHSHNPNYCGGNCVGAAPWNDLKALP